MVKHEIKSISINSAFKIGIVVNALLAAVLGGIVTLLQAALFSFLADIGGSFTVNGAPTNFNFAGFTLGALCFGWVIGIGVAAIVGGITFAVGALFYNLAARWVGGLEYTAAVYAENADPLAGQWDLTGRAGY